MTANPSPLLKVAVDARALEPDFRAHFGRGTGRYVKEVLSRFPDTPSPLFDMMHIRSSDLALSPFQSRVSSILPAGKVTYESQCCMNRNLQALSVSLAHFFFHGDAPAFPKVPQIVSVLDLIPLKFPELYQKGVGGLRYRFARYLERCAIKSSLGIITISEASKKDIMEIMNIPSEKIDVTYLGVDEKFFAINAHEVTPETKASFKNQFSIPPDGNLGLYIGGIDARKNLPFLLEVISELNTIEEIKASGGFHLALAGNYKNDDQLPRLKSLITRLQIADKLHFLGFIEEQELDTIFAMADMFIFPSIYEGFGLPVLEGMASGLPVIAGDNSSIPEVMGNIGWRFQDGDKAEWVRNIKEIVSAAKHTPQLFTSQAEKGKKRASQFTWEKTARETIRVYEKYTARLTPR
jgi:glycosyltransferase involved in cell wall biosynthesis